MGGKAKKGALFITQFIIAYIGGRKPASEEEGRRGMEDWKAWLQELGDAVVNPGTPLAHSQTVRQNGDAAATPEESRLSGYSVVEAESMEAALAIAKRCPFLKMGDLQVAQIMQMPGG